MLYHALAQEAVDRLHGRELQTRQLRTADEWRARQAMVRRALREEIMGPFPARTPLNARVTGVVRKPGFRVEKVIFESVPQFHVTAALFIPEGRRGPTPAIVFASGHTADAFRNTDAGSGYQWMILNLVKKGFIVFAFDPIGQGERVQAFDPAQGVSRHGKASAQHGFIGTLPFLANSWLGAVMAWDGVRAIDYLETRPEVDAKRLGMLGNSGGGTQTAYTSAIDERILASAPANYITTFRRLIASRGPQDPEQYLFRQIERGIDHADYLLARAPRPTLVVATTRDFFSIQGTHEAFAEARRAFTALGHPDNIALAEDDFEHGYTPRNREATYAFFQKHLGLPGSPKDEPVEFLPAEELRVTETGQVATALGGESFFTLSRRAAEGLVVKLEKARASGFKHVHRSGLAGRMIAGPINPPQRASDVARAGRYQRAGYVVEKHLMIGEYELPVPFLLFVPATPAGVRHPAVIYLHPKGKAADAALGGEIERLVQRGNVVLAPDLIGLGETGVAGKVDGWEMAMLIGRSLVGIRACDILRLVRVLQGRAEVDPQRIAGVAVGELGAELLHAAVVEKPFARVALLEPLVSWRALLEEEFADRRFVDGAVAGALVGYKWPDAQTGYDLPDLAAALAPRPLLIAGATNAKAEPAGAELIARDFAVVRASYERESATSALSIETQPAGGRIGRLAAWLAATPEAPP